jgi:hypothetical protein
MGFEFLLEPLVDSGQGPGFGIDQKEADRGLRKCRDDIGGPDPADRQVGNAPRKRRINLLRRDVGSHADHRNRIPEP